jgi:ATP-binding cassette subfamily F protein uup
MLTLRQIMQTYLQIDNLTKSFGDKILYENISFGIAQGQKIGLIARNGAGKTTLLNIIAGKESADRGKIVFRRDLKVGYLEQSPAYPPGISVLQACFYSQNETVRPLPEYELKAKQMLSLLKIHHFDQKTETLSGGQIKRVALASLLISEPEFILLDEPTNHLDLEMIEWLEDFLKRSTLSLLLVTHDRYFLDTVCNEIIEIENRQIYPYKGNYTYFLTKCAERLATEQAAADHAGNLLRKEMDWMRRQPQARATKAKYRIDAFHELEEKARQKQETENLKINVKSSYIGNKIFEARHVCKSLGETKILNDFNYVFSRYEKLGMVGNNGTGKSSFIKMLTGEMQPDSGRFDVGNTVRFGYYAQEGLQFDEQMKVIDTVRNIAEYITLGNGKSLSVSQFLNHFLFPPEKQHSYVFKLSGGEKRRLYLCTVFMKNPNFLILDEPTNDLDIATLNILEDYLADFKGCAIIISHDRYFLDRIVDHLLVFHGNAVIQDSPGNYTHYRNSGKETETPKSKKDAKIEPDKQNCRKPSGKRKLTYREQKELDMLETDISTLEIEKSVLEDLMNSGTLSVEELTQQSARYGVLLREMEEKTMRWLELGDMQ